jgi:short-subunit dehydrogenase
MLTLILSAKEHSVSTTSQQGLAVVTGASSGIGFELSRQFSEHGYDVLICAEEVNQLSLAAGRLSVGGANILTCATDLATQEGVNRLYDAIRASEKPVDVLCVNAGVGLGGAFVETDLQRELRMIDLNVRGAVQLTKLVLRDMVARDSGKILFTSSIAATMPDPFEAVYGATKVFLRWFGEALRNELKDTGVVATVLMPGVTDTHFFERADMLDTKAGSSDKKDDPAEVARLAFEALQKNKDKVIPTAKNKVLSAMAGMMPDTAAAQAHRGLSEPGSAKQ